MLYTNLGRNQTKDQSRREREKHANSTVLGTEGELLELRKLPLHKVIHLNLMSCQPDNKSHFVKVVAYSTATGK